MSEAVPKSGPIPINNVMKLRVGSLFVSDLEVLLRRLQPDEFKAFWAFRIEFVYGGCDGLQDDNKVLIQRLAYRKWPSLKQHLLKLGYLKENGGRLFDPDVADSVRRQIETSERQRKRAHKRYEGGAVPLASSGVAALRAGE